MRGIALGISFEKIKAMKTAQYQGFNRDVFGLGIAV